MKSLTIEVLKNEAREFSVLEGRHHEPSLYGVNDGKSIGTYIEQKFQEYLQAEEYQLDSGNAASGIDLPGLNVDIKTTSVRQPQSSCPFRSARQKIYGLGYHILLFVYRKEDDSRERTSTLKIYRAVFIHAERTADYQLTSAIRDIVENDGNTNDLVACFQDRHLPVDDITAQSLAEEILGNLPALGFLTISNALQWRLQYNRAIQRSGTQAGLECLHMEDVDT
ncbi:MAG: restriction endonuclease [Geitlerinemataceae cyanobacterium]